MKFLTAMAIGWAAAWFASPIYSADLTGYITHVRDGDTFEISTGDAVRLAGVNCPENSTVLGIELTSMLKKNLTNAPVECELTGARTFDRVVGYCSIGTGEHKKDLGEILISKGACGRCNRFDPEGRYISAEIAGQFSGFVPGYCK